MSQEIRTDSYDRQHQEASLNEGFANHPHLALPRGSDGDLFSELKMRAGDLVNDFSRHVRTNPWMHVAIAGTGALAVGYLLGRAFFKDDADRPVEAKEGPAGYDE